MDVDDVRRASTLVKIIDILRDYDYLEGGLETSNGLVRCVGLRCQYSFPAFVIEVQDSGSVSLPSFRRGNIFDGIFVPRASHVSECLQPAFCANAGATKYDDFFHNPLPRSFIWPQAGSGS